MGQRLGARWASVRQSPVSASTCDWTAKVPERRRALRKGVSSGFYSGPTGSGLTGDQDPGGL